MKELIFKLKFDETNPLLKEEEIIKSFLKNIPNGVGVGMEVEK